MQPSTIALYVTETMADWEYAYLTTQIAQAEEAKPGRFKLMFVGDGLDEVKSLGGLPVRPTADLAELVLLADSTDNTDGNADQPLAALVIPGGNRYDAGHERLLETVAKLLDRSVPVAAICGATYLMARGGLLDNRKHTSNAAVYLDMSGYAGGDNYVAAPVVTDQGITTASGIHPVAFTAEVMRLTGLYPERITNAWEQLNLTGEEMHFYELMEATNAWQKA
ncbi:thiamine biosynthesis protein ThiJ [Leucobacter coleopterorum]|uniref:Thiamine biosynthesis protein ThiJ n=1 Tax=Leucobacter coleopterorum TaxID=2714933 RepID=A0ABX6JZ86_9MICO|nr:DJ-1/PfpI family protein [Leucobacter coleopterorum]QIM18923.1 thiamine biosynthesis protein ThiJ [Leucobacter coleopterorum]